MRCQVEAVSGQTATSSIAAHEAFQLEVNSASEGGRDGMYTVHDELDLEASDNQLVLLLRLVAKLGSSAAKEILRNIVSSSLQHRHQRVFTVTRKRVLRRWQLIGRRSEVVMAKSPA